MELRMVISAADLVWKTVLHILKMMVTKIQLVVMNFKQRFMLLQVACTLNVQQLSRIKLVTAGLENFGFCSDARQNLQL